MINKKKILLTGVNSKIANYISKKLYEQKFELYGLTSSKNHKKKFYKKIGRINDDNYLKKILPTCKFILHIAWDRELKDNNNYNLYKKLQKLKNKRTKIIFFSTVAATPNSISNYGKQKYDISIQNLKNKNINLFIGLVDYESSKHLKLLNKFFNFKYLQLRFTKNIVNVYYVKISTLIKLLLKIINYKNRKSNILVIDKIFNINDFLDLCDTKKKIKFYLPSFLVKFLLKIIHNIKTKNTLIDQIKTFSYKDEKFLKKINETI